MALPGTAQTQGPEMQHPLSGIGARYRLLQRGVFTAPGRGDEHPPASGLKLADTRHNGRKVCVEDFSLNLSGSDQLTDAGLASLVSPQRLRHLDLAWCRQITDR